MLTHYSVLTVHVEPSHKTNLDLTSRHLLFLVFVYMQMSDDTSTSSVHMLVLSAANNGLGGITPNSSHDNLEQEAV